MYEDERGLVWGPQDGFLLSHSILVNNFQPLTLRGVHYQSEPFQRTKIIRCLSGAFRLAVVDISTGQNRLLEMRPGSMQVVERFEACGYLTLERLTLVHYEMHGAHSTAHEKGFRWNDPALGIDWGAVPAVINDRDKNWPDWRQGIT